MAWAPYFHEQQSTGGPAFRQAQAPALCSPDSMTLSLLRRTHFAVWEKRGQLTDRVATFSLIVALHRPSARASPHALFPIAPGAW